MYIHLPRKRIPVYIGILLSALFTSFMLGQGVQAIDYLKISMGDPEQISQEMLLERLEAVKELHTCIGTIQTVVDVEEENNLLGINLGSKKMLYVAIGNVRAGIDLRKVKPGDLQLVDGKLQAKLPPAEILDIKLDVERSYVYDVQKKLWAPDANGLQAEAENKAIEEVRKAALEAGMLKIADDCAKRALEMVE